MNAVSAGVDLQLVGCRNLGVRSVGKGSNSGAWLRRAEG